MAAFAWVLAASGEGSGAKGGRFSKKSGLNFTIRFRGGAAKAASSWRGAFHDDQVEKRPVHKPTGTAEAAKALREESRWLVWRAGRQLCTPVLPTIDGVGNGLLSFGKRTGKLVGCDAAG